MSKNSRIGRGLSSLMGNIDLNIRKVDEELEDKIMLLALEDIVANAGQPRKNFHQEHIDDLKNSIKSKGVISPILVRKVGDKYEIIAGERRYRAAKEAGLDRIPGIVRDMDSKESLEVAIIENIQRQALNAIEEAEAYKSLMEQCGYTQYDIAVAVGKSRSHIANLVRLLSLPEEVLEHLRQEKLTTGHARALIGREEALALAEKIIKQNLNVRQVERLIQEAEGRVKTDEKEEKEIFELLDDLKAIERMLEKKLNAKIRIKQGKKKLDTGHIRLEYNSLDELDRFLQILNKI